jgi:hypothetical protein
MLAEIWAMFMWSPQQMLYVIPMRFDTTFSSSSHRGAHFVQNSWFHSIPLTDILCSLLQYLYVIDQRWIQWRLQVSSQPKIQGLRSRARAAQLTGPRRPLHCSPKVWFRCCLTMWRKCGGAPSCMNQMCCRWWRGTCSNSTGKSFIKKKNGSTLPLLVC